MVKRKRYRFRQGDVIDVEEFHDGRYGGPGAGRTKRAKPTEEQMRAVNAQNKDWPGGVHGFPAGS